MTTETLAPPTDLERAINDLSDFAQSLKPGAFENGVLCSLVLLTRVRDGSGPICRTNLDYAMIRMNGFAPE